MLTRMSSNASLQATDPYTNATVSASAGCGKTWLLVTRIIRLLIEGAEPGSILALTFTRKAAAEMSIRLSERLYEMAIAGEADLVKALEATGAATDAKTQSEARLLYERCLHTLNPVRVQTFHAFCQDILSRFPLEANIPPGFELKEDTSQLEQQSWDSLFASATRLPQSILSDDLDKLMQVCNGPANTRSSLSSMLNQRNDWWAYTEHQSDPAAYASERLQDQLKIDKDIDPAKTFGDAIAHDRLIEFSTLLGKNNTATNLKFADTLSQLLSKKLPADEFFKHVQDIFLTKDKQPRSRKQSATQANRMGTENEERYLELNHLISQQLLDVIDLQKRCDTLKLNDVWYRTGQTYIDHFQQLKRELRVLDFSDLEWKCYQLLNTSENAIWIQYKIDQRIDHFLIDEFQDTNPTQWQLLKPLLEEIAANPEERWRSVFLVGDSKQSIYSFRRANPKLQAEATIWLQQSLAAIRTPLDSSRRSSPAIIDVVNQIFSQDGLQTDFPDFMAHDTHLKQLPGSVTLLPLCVEETEREEDEPALKLRNPLLEPRVLHQATARIDEAQLIAAQINEMMSSSLQITLDGEDRVVHYGDIMILMRNRTHSHVYENVLRQHNIPFISNQRGSFLNNLEINDLEKLLDSLITPFNNLAIAQVLKSPIFSASDDDLIKIAQVDNKKSWYQRLSIIAATNPEASTIIRAEKMLRQWRELADTIPVHDLLDRIFSEGNILQRYACAVPDTQKAQVKANLQQFLEMSLELNSGRYPSLSRFLDHLRGFRKQTSTAPDEPVLNTQEHCVRIMTIHASKGLESPVVFLADSNNTRGNNDAYSAMVYWPASTEKPTHFQLLTDKSGTDSITQTVQEKKTLAQDQEDLNLLYVASTRARQYLVVSGTQTTKTKPSAWYPLIKSGIETLETTQIDNVIRYSYGQYNNAPLARKKSMQQEPAVLDPSLRKPIPKIRMNNYLIAPSRITADAHPDLNETRDDGRERGIVIHRAIELFIKDKNNTVDSVCHQLSLERACNSDDEDLKQWTTEAHSIVNNPLFSELFQTDDRNEYYSELPLLYKDKGQAVYGIVDRLVVKESEILLIDYKSHSCDSDSNLQELADSFIEQMELYKSGVTKIWPSHTIKTGILFTHCAELIWLDI